MSDDLNAAIHLAQQMKNAYRAFARAEEFLRAVAAAQSALHEIDERKKIARAELEAQIGDLERRLGELKEAVAAAESNAAAAEAECRERISVARVEAEQVVRDAKAALAKLQDSTDREKKALLSQIEALRSQRDDEDRRYREAKAKREELLRQLGG